MTWFSVIPTALLSGAAVFGIAVLAVSHLRFRRLLLEAREAAGAEGVDAAGAELLLLALPGRREELTLLVLENASEDLHGEADWLRKNLRSRDEVIPLRGGGMLLALRTTAANRHAVATRLLEGLARRGRAGVVARMPVEGLRVDRVEELPAPGEAEEAPPPPPGVVDELTGTLAGHRIPGAFARQLASHRRRNIPMCALRVDVDGMGEINRHRGREAGDRVLRRVAELLMKGCRETDLIGRIGMDEFLICMPGKPGDCLEAARRMAVMVKGSEMGEADGARVTVSIGVAGAPDHGQSPGALYQAAGIALEQARGRGRGQCMCWDRSMKPRGSEERPESAVEADRF